MTSNIEHITRITCSCGGVVEVPSKPDWNETELGSQYATIRYDRPSDWGYDYCPACKGDPVDTKVTVHVVEFISAVAGSAIYNVKMRVVDQGNKKHEVTSRLDIWKKVFLDLPENSYVAAVLQVSAESVAKVVYKKGGGL
jgi:hypothetical protein